MAFIKAIPKDMMVLELHEDYYQGYMVLRPDQRTLSSNRNHGIMVPVSIGEMWLSIQEAYGSLQSVLEDMWMHPDRYDADPERPNREVQVRDFYS